MNNPIFLMLLVALSCACSSKKEQQSVRLTSPGDQLKVVVGLDNDQRPFYQAFYKEEPVVDTSYLGVILDKGDLTSGLKIVSVDTSSFDETWEQPWGEERWIRNNYRELTVGFQKDGGPGLNLVFRLYDQGVAFRYVFPESAGLESFTVLDEQSEFNLIADHPTWSIPAYGGNRYEYIYQKKPVSDLDLVHTPFTVEATNGLYYHIHEAALYDYPSMVLKRKDNHTLTADLVPLSKTDPSKAYLEAPFQTPWRTVQVGEKPGDLITNYMILNLNEPNKLGDVSWVKPGKYMGVWWEMFIDLGTWHQGPKHAANTKNVKKYIDFAGKHGFSGVLVEGWNHGWDGNWMNGGTRFDFTRPYPDYDIEELSRYAAEKGVYLIGHHETGANTENYEQQLEPAYQYLQKYGMKAVKTGYVENGDTLPNGYYHHGQYFVKHFQSLFENA
ncbi:MAG: glycoside hydrolase family 97 N-terminal domain-containing protein, partial [Bacteroidota bacterium]